MIAKILPFSPRRAAKCLRLIPILGILAAALVSSPRPSTAAIYTDVDSHFTLIGTVGHSSFSNPTVTYTATYQSDQNLTNVKLLFPFAYQIDVDSVGTNQFPWNNSTKKWENGGNSLSIYGVSGQSLLALMSNSDVPLTDPAPPAPLGAETVLGTDTVPLVSVGNFTAFTNKVVSFDVLSAPGSSSILYPSIAGFFVTPEPGTFVIFGCGLVGLLVGGYRRRRAKA